MVDVVIDYLQHIRTRSAPATYYRKRLTAEAFIDYLHNCNKQLVDIKKPDIETYLHTRDHCCRETVRMHWRTIRELYDVLRLPDNPAKGIYFRRVPRRSIKLPSNALLEQTLATVNGYTDVIALRNSLMVELAYGSGLRREELVRMNVEDVDLTIKTAYIQGKGKRTRLVPLTSKAVTVTRAYVEKRQTSRGPLFVSKSGRRLGVLRIYQIFKETTGFRPHIFRHACATHMLRNGCDIRIVQELLGHRLLTSTQHYTHTEKEMLRKVIKRFHPRSEKRAYGCKKN